MANMAPVFAMKLFPGWNARIDGGREWKDGRAILGAGKTWRGLVAGSLLGSLTAFAQSFIGSTDVPFNDFGASYTAAAPWLLGLGLGFGAIVGDAVKSFFKRRTGREGGAPWVPFDQLDFVVGGLLFALVLSLLLVPFTAWTGLGWWADEFLGANWPRLVILLLATPLLHFVVNIIGYKLKLKKVPW
ncbi:MAG: CDP-archaeol synthase [Euryarchaeota archaeon]|nr:CDP-archaeol synthase [Euryarchaeota archaeon]